MVFKSFKLKLIYIEIFNIDIFFQIAMKFIVIQFNMYAIIQHLGNV